MGNNLKLVCHACKYEISSFSKDVRTPLLGAMFLSKDEKHKFPAPWSPVITFEHMYCPMCQIRPFGIPVSGINGDEFRVITNKGKAIIDNKGVFLAEDRNIQYSDGPKDSDELVINRGFTFTPVGEKIDKEVQKESTNDVGNLSTHEQGTKEEDIEKVTDVSDSSSSTDGPIGPEGVNTPDESGEAKGLEADPSPADVGGPVHPVSFQEKLEAGEIVKAGSWYRYKNESYRKDELIKLFGI